MSSRKSFIPSGEIIQKQDKLEYVNWATTNTTRHASPLRATIMLSNNIIAGMDSIQNEHLDDIDIMLSPWDDSTSPVEINNNTYRNPVIAPYQDKIHSNNSNSRITNFQRAYYAGKNISQQSAVPGAANKSYKDNISTSAKNLKKLKETTTHNLLVPLLTLSDQDKKKINLPSSKTFEEKKEIEQIEGLLFQRDKTTESSSTCSSIRKFLASSTSPSRGIAGSNSATKAAVFSSKSTILSNVSAEGSKILNVPLKTKNIIQRIQKIPQAKNDQNQDTRDNQIDIRQIRQEYEGDGECEAEKEPQVDDIPLKTDQQNPHFNPKLSAKMLPFSAPQFILLQKINNKQNNSSKNHNNNTVNQNFFHADQVNNFSKNQSDGFFRQTHQQSTPFHFTYLPQSGQHETSFKKLFFSRNESMEMAAPNDQHNFESLSLKGKSCKQHQFQLFTSKTIRTFSKDRSESFKNELQQQNISQGFLRKNIPFARYAINKSQQQQQQQQQQEIKKQKQSLISSYLGVSRNQVNNEYQQCEEQIKSSLSCKQLNYLDKNQQENQHQQQYQQPLNQIKHHQIPLMNQQFPQKSKHLGYQDCLESINNRDDCRNSEILLINNPQQNIDSRNNEALLAQKHEEIAEESAFCDKFLRTNQKVSTQEQTDFEAISEVDLYNSTFEIRIPRSKNCLVSEQQTNTCNKQISSNNLNPLKVTEKKDKWMFYPESSSVTSSSSHQNKAISNLLSKQQINEYNQTQKEESIRSLSETAFQPRSSSLIVPSLHLSKKGSKFQYLTNRQQTQRGYEETEDKVQNIYLKTTISHTERKKDKEQMLTEENYNYQQENTKAISQTERNNRLPLNSILLKHQQAMRNKREKKNNEFKQGILQALSSLKSNSKQ